MSRSRCPHFVMLPLLLCFSEACQCEEPRPSANTTSSAGNTSANHPGTPVTPRVDPALLSGVALQLPAAAPEPEALREALAAGATHETIETSIDRQAILNTSRPGGRQALDSLDLRAAAEQQVLPDFANAAHVVYWVRQVGPADPSDAGNLVGVVWPRDGEPSVFYARAVFGN